jgi:hypothetical protein
MEFIKRYFKTVEEANTFIQQINTILGIPVSETATTRTYTEYQTDEDGIYVMYENYIGELLGEPIEITI